MAIIPTQPFSIQLVAVSTDPDENECWIVTDPDGVRMCEPFHTEYMARKVADALNRGWLLGYEKGVADGATEGN